MTTHGLVVGKFYPPHKGHSHLIETALAGCDEVTVLVCDLRGQVIPAKQRAQWIKQMHPTANVRVIVDIGNDDNSELWAGYTKWILGRGPDFVYTSESYGDPYSHFLGATHVMVDAAREKVPVHASDIWHYPIELWDFMDPIVRPSFAKRVALVGAESTGKTTLAKELAARFETAWVPEFGRFMSEAKIGPAGYEWTSDEFDFIAGVQNATEDVLARSANKVLICDTDSFATSIWHERYMGSVSETVEEIAKGHHIDLYLVPAPDIPFVDDGLRDGREIRDWMHGRFVDELTRRHLPFVVIDGSREKRFNRAVAEIDGVLKEPDWRLEKVQQRQSLSFSNSA